MRSKNISLIGIIVLFAFISLNVSNGRALGTEEKKDIFPTIQNYQSQDILFKEPYVDIDEWRDEPVRHRYIHGDFKDHPYILKI